MGRDETVRRMRERLSETKDLRTKAAMHSVVVKKKTWFEKFLGVHIGITSMFLTAMTPFQMMGWFKKISKPPGE